MDAYIGEIRAFGFNYVTPSWLPCDGRTLPIAQYQALYSLIGNLYGGQQSQNSFALPNLQGVLPACRTANWPVASQAGANTVTLNISTTPAHNHTTRGAYSNGGKGTTAYEGKPEANANYFRIVADITGPTSSGLAQSTFAVASAPTALSQQALSVAGGLNGTAVPHENRQPYLALNFMICVLDGVYPVNG